MVINYDAKGSSVFFEKLKNRSSGKKGVGGQECWQNLIFWFFVLFFAPVTFIHLLHWYKYIADCVLDWRRSVGSIVANTSIYYDIHDFSCSCRTVHGRDVGRPTTHWTYMYQEYITPQSVQLHYAWVLSRQNFELTSFRWCNAHCTRIIRRIRNLWLTEADRPCTNYCKEKRVMRWHPYTCCKSLVQGAMRHKEWRQLEILSGQQGMWELHTLGGYVLLAVLHVHVATSTWHRCSQKTWGQEFLFSSWTSVKIKKLMGKNEGWVAVGGSEAILHEDGFFNFSKITDDP